MLFPKMCGRIVKRLFCADTYEMQIVDYKYYSRKPLVLFCCCIFMVYYAYMETEYLSND